MKLAAESFSHQFPSRIKYPRVISMRMTLKREQFLVARHTEPWIDEAIRGGAEELPAARAARYIVRIGWHVGESNLCP